MIKGKGGVSAASKTASEVCVDVVCCCSYLVGVYQVEDQVYVSVYGLVLSQLRLHPVQPVNESLESVCKLSREQQGLLKLVLSAREHRSITVNEESLIVSIVIKTYAGK